LSDRTWVPSVVTNTYLIKVSKTIRPFKQLYGVCQVAVAILLECKMLAVQIPDFSKKSGISHSLCDRSC
jgi:hypothetical protein